MLNLRGFHGSRAFLVVVAHVVDPRAYWIAAHQPSVVRFQKLGDDSYALHSGIEPKIVAVCIEHD